jgi:spore maturation protein CgeB
MRLNPTTLADLSVLVLNEHWHGNTGLSAFDAMLRLGVRVSSISEEDFIPSHWRSKSLRVLARALNRFTVDEFNEALLRDVRQLKPQLFFAVKGTFVRSDTLRAIKEMGTRAYCFFPDISSFSHGRYLAESILHYDWIFTTKSFGPADLQRQLGISTSSYLPHAYDLRIHRPWAVTPKLMRQFGCDVSFIGAWSPKKERILEELVNRWPEIDFKLWGNSWDRMRRGSPLRRYSQMYAVTGTAYAAAICCTKVNLALLREAMDVSSSGDRITSRTFHIPACGGFMLHERTDDLLQYFVEGESCECFDGIDELVTKLKVLLSDGERRARVAAAGKRVVEAGHSWDHRATTILEHFVEHHGGGMPLP